MAKAEKMPSGNWHIRVYDNALKKQVHFTAETKKEVELLAAEYKAGIKRKPSQMTVGQAIDDYIKQKENILAPTTVSCYKTIRNGVLKDLEQIRLCDLTNGIIQAHINKLAINRPPKTVRNAHGLLVSVLNIYLPDFRVRTTLPPLQKKIKEYPTVDEIIAAVRGTDVELPCMMALWCGMRMSEIRGARFTDIKDGVLTIRNTMLNVEGKDVERHATKTYDSTRRIRLPSYILNMIAALSTEQEFIVPMNGRTIYKKYKRILRNNNLPDITFHDLRHMNASTMLALGIPDKYAMERGGWSSPHVMKSVYQHTFTAEREAVDDKIDEFFEQRIG